MLEREDQLGGCIRTAELTEPGYLHDVFSAWHPLWVGGAAHAELADDLARRGLEYLNTDHPTATLTPEGEATFLLRSTEANVGELGEEWRGAVESFLPNADLAFGVLGTELWSREGMQLGLRTFRRLGRRGAVEFVGDVLTSSRDWLTQTFRVRAGARRARAVGPAHRPRAGQRGLRIHDAGDRGRGAGGRDADPAWRRGAARRRARASHRGQRRLVRDRPRRRAGARPGRQGGGRAHRRRRGDPGGPRGDRQRHADAALRPARRRARGARPALPVRAFRDADPLRALGAAALGGRRAARADGDRAPDARARRRLARGQRGRARAAAGRGDRRGRSAADDGSEPGTRRRRAALDPAAGAAVAGEGRRGRRARRRRRHVDGGPARALRRPHPGADRPARAEPRERRFASASPSRRPTCRRRTSTCTRATRTRARLSLDQNLLWRPLPASPGHSTPVDRLWHIGASTHPGPGLGAGSGTMVAKRLLRRRLRR